MLVTGLRGGGVRSYLGHSSILIVLQGNLGQRLTESCRRRRLRFRHLKGISGYSWFMEGKLTCYPVPYVSLPGIVSNDGSVGYGVKKIFLLCAEQHSMIHNVQGGSWKTARN